MALRAEARREAGVAAACLLSALGQETHENDGEYVRAYVGALMLAEGLNELTNIRRLLTAPE